MPIAKLSIDLEARLAGLEQGLQKAATMSAETSKKMADAFGLANTSLKGLGAGLAAGFSIAGIAGFVRTTIDGLDALNDLRDATGASIENISALEDVAARTGTSFESMSSTLVKFNKVLGEAKPGSQSANILKEIGLSAQALKAEDPAEALRQTAVALSKFANDGDKARIVQELFGKSVAEAAPFLKDLAEQGRLNAKVTTEQAQAAEDFNKQLFSLQKNAKDAGRALTADLLSGVNQLFDAVGGRAAGGESKLSEWIAVPLQAASVLGANVSFVLKGVGKEIGGIAAQAEAVARLDFAGAASIGQQMREGAKAAREEFDQLERRLMGIGQAFPVASYSNEGRGRGDLPGIGGIPSAEKDKKLSEVDKYIDRLEKAREAALGLSTEEQAYADIYLGRLGKINAETEFRIITTIRETEERKKLSEQEKQLQAIIANTPTGKLEEMRKTQILLADAFEKGRFGIVGSEDALRRYSEAVSTTLPEVTKTWISEIEKVDEQTRQFADDIDALLGNGLENALSGNYKNILKDWESMLAQMGIRAAQAKLSQYLLGSDYKSTGYVGGVLGSLLGTGGTYPTGGYYDGGARGGYILPGARGQSAVSQGGRQSVTHVHNYYVQGGVSRGEVISALQTSERVQEARTVERLRRAGIA